MRQQRCMGVRRPPELMDFRLRHCSVQASSSVSATGRGSKGNGVLPCPCDTGSAGSGHLRAFCVVVTRPPENDDGQATGVIRSSSVLLAGDPDRPSVGRSEKMLCFLLIIKNKPAAGHHQWPSLRVQCNNFAASAAAIGSAVRAAQALPSSPPPRDRAVPPPATARLRDPSHRWAAVPAWSCHPAWV